MRTPLGCLAVNLCLAIFLSSLASAVACAAETDSKLAQQVEKLVRQLNDDQAARRDEAEAELLKLAPTANAQACDEFLQLLPKPIEGMPAEVRLRLVRLRKRIETEQSSRALAESKLTLSADQMDLAELFAEIAKQTGNQLSDHREQFGQNATARPVTIEIDDEPFWPALDRILDAARMTTYPFSGEDNLAIINSESGALPRSEGASYAGPFRIQAATITARRDLRSAQQETARVELEVAWEPRIRPIALSQSIDGLEVTTDEGSTLGISSQQETLNVEVQPGTHATEFTIPLDLPPRSATKLASFKGRMSALVPGRIVEFKFDNLDRPTSSTQSRGGVNVTLQGARRNQDLWEVHMKIEVESAETGLESHRGWVFQNLTYLLNPQGELIDNAGFETTLQTETEVGFAYFFELPDQDLSNYTWVYRTPAAIVRLPVEFELNDIPLP